MQYGQIVTAKISDENEKAYYAQYKGTTFEMDKSQLEPDESYQLNEEIEGLIYETKSGKRIIQVNLPDIRPGYYGWGQVVASRKDLGVFVDVGLIDKDIVVSLDDLPENRNLWPRKNDRLFLSYQVDNRNRFWGDLADQEMLDDQFKKAPERLMNQVIKGWIYQIKLAGILLISQEGYRIFIHETEIVGDVRLGKEVEVRIIKVAPDGSLNGSLKPRAHEMISDDAQMLLQLLNRAPQGFLPFHDKSDPQAIKQKFGISKAQFKRAVGQLMKEEKIVQEKEKGIRLRHAES